jgi:hypothetical protein
MSNLESISLYLAHDHIHRFIDGNDLDNLELIDIHKDYVELFLDNTATLLSDNLCLSVEYRPLRKVTNNLKKDTMRFNCANVIELMIPDKFKISQSFKAYFPHVKISQFY